MPPVQWKNRSGVSAMPNYGLFFLVAVAFGGVLWVFVYPILSGERKAERRVASVARTDPMKRQTRAAAPKARRDVEGTLKEIEERSKQRKRVPLPVRIEQAGLTWSKQKFFVISGVLGLVAFLLMILALGVVRWRELRGQLRRLPA